MTINNNDEDAFKVDNYQPNVYIYICIMYIRLISNMMYFNHMFQLKYLLI